MAGEWIKVQNVTPDKPEVFVIADRLGIEPDAVIGKLIRVWIWADQQTTDGNAASVTKSLLDRISGVTGFADAMQFAGWLANDGGLYQFPNFDRHNGQTSKTRSLAAKRADKFRGKNRNAPGVTQALPEKRREETNSSGGSSRKNRREVSTTEMQAVADGWNMLGAPFRAVRRIHNKRRKTLTARLADDDWRTNWQAALERVQVLKFCRGGGDRGWIASFDWFIKPNTVTEILEGKYDDRQRTSAAGQPRRETAAEVRERGNHEAIAGFLRSSGVRSGDGGADGIEADVGLHGGPIESVARRIGDVPF